MSVAWTLIGLGAATLVAGAVLVGCRSGGAKGERIDVLERGDVARGAYSGVMERGGRVLRTPTEWEALWASHARLQLPAPPAPALDFDETMVVAVFCGQCPTAGYGVEIEEVKAVAAEVDGDLSRVVVFARQTEPGADVAVAQVITAPFHIVQVPRADGDLEVVWE